MSETPDNLSPRMTWLLLALFGLPLALMAAKTPGLPTAEYLSEHLSLEHLTPRLQNKVAGILFVPLGSLLVVLFRLTLGIRVLGPFRSLLLAAAFHTTGILLGVVFLVVTGGIVVAARAPIRSLKLPYFGRYTVLLSVVAVVMIVGVLASEWMHVDYLRNIVYLPIVVLCLIADAFANTVKKEGVASAVWRGATTAIIAAILTLLSDIPQVRHALLRYPELLLVQIGGIIVVSKFLAFRLLKSLNPHQGDGEDEPEESDEAKTATKPQLSHAVAAPRLSHFSDPLTAERQPGATL